MELSHRAHVEAVLRDAAVEHRELLSRLPPELRRSLPVDAQGLTRAIDVGGATLVRAVRGVLVENPPPAAGDGHEAVLALEATYAAQEEVAMLIAAALDAAA